MIKLSRTGILYNKGFTLIELVFVVVIIATLVAIASPRVIDYIRMADSRSAAFHSLSVLRRARSTAISTNLEQQVVFNNGTYGTIAGNQAFGATFPPIPTSGWTTMALVSTGPITTIQFIPNGSASVTGTVSINDNNGILRYQIVVSQTGRISMTGPL